MKESRALMVRGGRPKPAEARGAHHPEGSAIQRAIAGGCLLLTSFVASAQNQTVPIPLAPGVANVGQGYAVAQATRAGSLVALNGVVRPAQGVLGTLPPSLRPQGREIFMVITGRHTPARVDVTPDGRIQVVAGGSNDSISLSGIVFAAAP